MTDFTSPKVFISYSWQPASNKEKVIALANRLVSNGVEVFLDVWDLKEGQDSNAFMERMVTNPEVSRVLIVMNKSYAEKANQRKGGVGTETQIMSTDIYAKADQTKFIPLAFERDEENNYCVPTFLKGRIFIDFTDETTFEKNFEQLLRNIFSTPQYTRPVLGNPPAFANKDIPSNAPSIIKDSLPPSVDARVNALIQEGQQKAAEDLPILRVDSVSFFAQRIGKSFPGVRGLEWFNNPSIAVDRLMLLLQQPLKFRVGENDNGHLSPIWWFRAGSSMMIEDVERISDNKILMDGDELVIKRIAVFESSRHYQCFVYVEASGEPQTGAHDYTDEQIKEMKEDFGYVNEEYGLLGEQVIKRTEYDDGAAVVNGKVVDAGGAVLRSRFLTDYNFIITANDAPYNSNKFDAGSDDFFDAILNNTRKPEELFEWMKTFRKHEQ